MKAVIMAGGRGSRLHPLTKYQPKPMLTFIDKPVLAHILDLLKQYDITEVIITVGYLAEQIQGYFYDGRHLGMIIQYAWEDTPLGTAGGVKNAQRFLDDDTFLVMSGDVITDINLDEAIQMHHQKRALATMILKAVANPSEYGAVVTDQQGYICRYEEKPKSPEYGPAIINTGIYILEPDVLRLMEPSHAYDFSYDIFPRLLEEDLPIFGYRADGYWCDMGTIQSYRQAKVDALIGRVNLATPKCHIIANHEASSNPDFAVDPLRVKAASIKTISRRKAVTEATT